MTLMNESSIINHIASESYIDAENVKALFNLMELKHISKNSYLCKKGDIEPYLYYVTYGCLLTYYEDENQGKHVIQFGIEKWWTGDLGAFNKEQNVNYNIKTLENSSIYFLSKSNFEYACANIPQVEYYFRLLFQKSLVSHQKRLIGMISMSGTERYLDFLKHHPHLVLTVPQKYIASYLGMTPEFLSKIRGKIGE